MMQIFITYKNGLVGPSSPSSVGRTLAILEGWEDHIEVEPYLAGFAFDSAKVTCGESAAKYIFDELDRNRGIKRIDFKIGERMISASSVKEAMKNAQVNANRISPADFVAQNPMMF